jgi:hypothetical protein
VTPVNGRPVVGFVATKFGNCVICNVTGIVADNAELPDGVLVVTVTVPVIVVAVVALVLMVVA